jgi:hypothetical protein
VRVWVREQKLLQQAQALFVESAHGDGHAQAAGEARGVMDRAYRVGVRSGTPVLSEAERVAGGEGFDEWVEKRCAKFYAANYGRPSLTPGIYFRALLIGYFEGIGAERGIAWRLADRGLLKGQRIAIDATTLEANAAMRSIVRRDTGESYEEFLRGLAKASGILTPTREDLARLDRKRKKRTSNKEWKSPADEDARIAKMKDGRTHLAHKAEHAVDLDTGAVVAVTLQGADQGDTTTLDEIERSRDGGGGAGGARGRITTRRRAQGERGRHRGDGYRQGLSRRRGGEADEGVRRAQLHCGEETIRDGGTGRAKRPNSKRCTRTGGGCEASTARVFAHCYETGGLRRCHLRGQGNILKRQLIHVGAFNLSLILRQLLGAGTPREWNNRFGRLVGRVLRRLWYGNGQQRFRSSRISAPFAQSVVRLRTRLPRPLCRKSATCTTGR